MSSKWVRLPVMATLITVGILLCFFTNLDTQILSLPKTQFPSKVQTLKITSDRFAVRLPLNFPITGGTWPVSRVLAAAWVDELKAFLMTLNSSLPNSRRQVNVVTGDSRYLPVLLNWLIMSQVRLNPPLENILIVALDWPLHHLLYSRRIPHVYAEPSSVLDVGAEYIEFSEIWIIRCIVLRLLNHWGYDVVNYDVDAIPLKNSDLLFDRYPDSDIVASSGTYPEAVGSKWGNQTLCMGVVLFRASNRMEELWEVTSRVINYSLDDQEKLNYGLLECKVEWKRENMSRAGQIGTCKNGLRVTLLPKTIICRQCDIDTIDNYTVWHNLSPKNSSSKQTAAPSSDLWHLRPDWQQLQTEDTGYAWLRSISLL